MDQEPQHKMDQELQHETCCPETDREKIREYGQCQCLYTSEKQVLGKKKETDCESDCQKGNLRFLPAQGYNVCLANQNK